MPSFVFTAASFSVCNVERNQIVLKFTQVVICGLGLVLVDGLVHVLTRNNFCVLCHGHLCLYEFPCWLCYSQVIVSNCCDLCAVAGDASASVCVAEASVRGVVWKQLVSIEGGMPSSSHKAVCLPRWFLQQKYIRTYTWCSVQQCHSIPTHWIDHTVALCPFVKQDEKQS